MRYNDLFSERYHYSRKTRTAQIPDLNLFLPRSARWWRGNQSQTRFLFPVWYSDWEIVDYRGLDSKLGWMLLDQV